MVTDPKQNTVLFLCTGNYYRSRYAEIVFNELARERGLPWIATSRGLAPSPRNVGPLSQHTHAALGRRGIDPAPHLRDPIAVTDADFAAAGLVVAVKEAEHRAMVERNFPQRISQVEFWHVHDLDCSEPVDTIASLDVLLVALVERLQTAAR